VPFPVTSPTDGQRGAYAVLQRLSMNALAVGVMLIYSIDVGFGVEGRSAVVQSADRGVSSNGSLSSILSNASRLYDGGRDVGHWG
jgi:hypothetical protein